MNKLRYFIKKTPKTIRININRGWGNGYVVIPKNHNLYGKHYDDINVQVHGELTYAKRITNTEIDGILEKDCWVIGFDTSHYGDDAVEWNKNAVLKETKNLFNQIENYEQ